MLLHFGGVTNELVNGDKYDLLCADNNMWLVLSPVPWKPSHTWLCCTACPTRVHCRLNPTFLQQPPPWTPGWGYLRILREQKKEVTKNTHTRHFLRRARLESRPLKVNSPLVKFITHFHVHVFMRNHVMNSAFFYRLMLFSKNLGAAY